MKRMFLLLTGCCFALAALAQTDTTGKSNQSDTIRVGGMIIIKKGKSEGERRDHDEVQVHRRRSDYKPSNVSTNWFIFDLGFANYNDQTNYGAAQAQGFVDASVAKDHLDLRTGKSVNVNLWFFMQKLNVVKHVVNLKYGLGLETNNYRYESDIKFLKKPTMVIMDSLTHAKDKLAADYVTIPLMLNFNFTPRREEGFGFSIGASAGYLYSSRQKFKGGSGGKYKNRGNFDLEPWKISYIAELQFGPVKFYGSYATRSMFKKGLDQTPYTVGIRFSNW